MVQRPPYQRLERKLVIAFDVGTTYSGASYCLLDPGETPKIQGVNQYPAQERVGGDSKIPSILYYDADGRVAAVGAEALQETVIEKAEENDWVKVEWFKLHLRPAYSLVRQAETMVANEDGWDEINNDEEIPSLPPNKNVIEVFADFLRYLFGCTRDWIKERHANGPSLWAAQRRKIHFILSHPNGWEGPQQALMRRAAAMAGLVPDNPKGHDRIEFVTEGEASLHYCISNDLASDVAKSGAGVIIVDAGGGTVDVSSYAMTAPRAYSEIASADCIFQGSVYVTRRTRAFLEDKLHKAKSRYSTKEDIQIIVDAFDKTTKLTVQEGEPAFIKFGTARDKDINVNIRGGKLKLEAEEVVQLFEPAVQGIIKAIEKQRMLAHTPVAAVFLVGGFAASKLLFSKLQNHFENDKIIICRPDNHTNKAVADGAISYYVDHFVSARISKLTYGTPCIVSYKQGNEDHETRLHNKGSFGNILPIGASVLETTEFRKYFTRQWSYVEQMKTLTAEILCYRGNHTTAPEWLDKDPHNFSTLCTVKADISQFIQDLKPRYGPSGLYYSKSYEVIMSFGLTEIRAQIAWIENGVEKRGAAMVVYDELN